MGASSANCLRSVEFGISFENTHVRKKTDRQTDRQAERKKKERKKKIKKVRNCVLALKNQHKRVVPMSKNGKTAELVFMDGPVSVISAVSMVSMANWL